MGKCVITNKIIILTELNIFFSSCAEKREGSRENCRKVPRALRILYVVPMSSFGSSGGVVVKLLACGARGTRFDSRSRRYDFRAWLSPTSKS